MSTIPRLYPILDTALLEARRCPLEVAAGAMIEAGARILQIRHKGHWSRDVFEQASRVSQLCAAESATLIVNDRADIAMLLRAGLHIGQDDLPPQEARRLIGPLAILGYSTHNAEQLAAADREPVNYLALGPLFATQSKAKPDPVVGVEGLRAWRSLSTKPVVAIGGITRANALSAIEAGANSVAAIGDLLPENISAESIRERMRDWHRTIGAHE